MNALVGIQAASGNAPALPFWLGAEYTGARTGTHNDSLDYLALDRGVKTRNSVTPR